MGFAKSPGSGGGGILGNTGVEDGVESITRTFGMREVCILMPVFAGLLVGGGGDIGHGTPCPGDAGEGWGEGWQSEVLFALVRREWDSAACHAIGARPDHRLVC